MKAYQKMEAKTRGPKMHREEVAAMEKLPPGLAADPLEEWARVGAQKMLAVALEEEVQAYLGRDRYERNEEFRGHRNGYHAERRVTLGSGTIGARVPRVRAIPEEQEPFESKYLESYPRRSRTVSELFPELFIQGLATRDFEPALRCLLGETAALSPATVSRLNAQFRAEYQEWAKRPLDKYRIVYAWADGLYLKAGVGKEKAAMLVIIGAGTDGTKHVLALQEGYRESEDSWKELLRDLKKRGLRAPALVCGDGALGFWLAAAEIWPETLGQRCWNHKMLNILDKLPKALHGEARQQLRAIYMADSEAAARKLAENLANQWQAMYPRAADCLTKDLDALLTYWKFPVEHHKHLRTTNVVESPFATVRLRTNAAKRLRTARSGVHLIYQILKRAQTRWQRLAHPEKLREVALPDEKVKDGPKKKVA